MDAAAEKYVLFTTFRRDGTPVATPVWCTPLDSGSFGFWTSSGSGKAKRLAHDGRVLVQPCSNRGTPKAGSAEEEMTARVVTGAELEDIRTRIVAKYGFMTKVTKFLWVAANTIKRRSRPYGDRGVIVSPAA